MIEKKENPDCIFCLFAHDKEDVVNKLYEDDDCFVIADKFPITKGHLLVIPKEHYDVVENYSQEQQLHVHKILIKTNHAILKSLPKYTATNILLNNGKDSGQHIPHTHWHIIPRKPYDKVAILFNFLTRFINPLNYLHTKQINIQIEK